MSDTTPTEPLRQRLPLFALLCANAVSEVGNMLTFVAVPWFVLQTTGSAARTGLVGAAATLAFVASALLGGPIVDRFGFKRTSIVADLASGVTVALIPLLYVIDALPFLGLLTLVFLGAILDTPGMTARQGLVPDLAGAPECRWSGQTLLFRLYSARPNFWVRCLAAYS